MLNKLKTSYLGVARRIFNSDYIPCWCKRSDEQSGNTIIKDMVRELNYSNFDSVNPYFNYEYNSIERVNFLIKFYTEDIKQSKDILKNLRKLCRNLADTH